MKQKPPITYEAALAKKKEADRRARQRRELKKLQVKPKKPPTKKERVKTLKRKLWAQFSMYIRKKYANEYGMVMTCDGQYLRWQDTHCGHLLTNTERSQSLGGNELWYYEKNFAPQSANGNYFNANDSAKRYMLWAVGQYGEEEIHRMYKMKQTPHQFTEEELQAKLEHYKALFAKL